MGSQRYIYLGDKLTSEHLRFQLCTAVTAPNGKCIRSRMGTMLVDFGSLGKVIVLARRLRRIKECTISEWGCVYHACMSDDCQKAHMLKHHPGFGPGKCEKG